ncbi:MAG: cell division protein FtsQ/DivIB [Candidatus Omnitrophica bacterium]|nr:cell division protein FtsQ/DivIB [Candidatus Omnitrophota bacterium]MBU4418740.1 cell division protein FtsQ/DivIB [Candidatus Omnitrophota bacterium]MBU4468154.1 cell division protein FtsQ/DivIB [Candidatus Omnitrophota bacterium]MCG2707616.1 cell division protein FtsQ/DivIB [Candidatus Omnitrophota bacterium]
MRKQKFNLPVKLISFLVIISLAFSFIIGYIWKVLTTADFFSVKQVIVRDSDNQFEYLKGRNIFSLNLSNEAWRAHLSCPDCRKVRFARILPNCIVVDFLKRKPVALVKFYKNFAIDAGGVLFIPDPAAGELELPVIYGLETKIFAPKPGTSYKHSALGLALSIINEFKENKAFAGFTLKRIEVSSPGSAGFFMLLPGQIANSTLPAAGAESAGFEVRTGVNNIRQKMMILGGLIIQERKEWAKIKYIDLRFKEPLIKLNNVK